MFQFKRTDISFWWLLKKGVGVLSLNECLMIAHSKRKLDDQAGKSSPDWPSLVVGEFLTSSFCFVHTNIHHANPHTQIPSEQMLQLVGDRPAKTEWVSHVPNEGDWGGHAPRVSERSSILGCDSVGSNTSVIYAVTPLCHLSFLPARYEKHDLETCWWEFY